MQLGPHHEIVNLRRAPGELTFEARIGERSQSVWMRSDTPVTPNPEAALAACLMPAMREGGSLEIADALSPRVLRGQREFQAVQAAWSLDWTFGEEPLREVDVRAPTAEPQPSAGTGRVAALFSGGVDSWATVLGNPEVTDLIFVRGFDLVPGASHQERLGDEVEARLREAAAALGLPLHVVDTNLRKLSDAFLAWECYFGCAAVAVTHFLAPLFDRVLIAGDSDYQVQEKFGASHLVEQLWSSEQLEIVEDGGRFSRIERLRRIADHPIVQQTLRVCWENPDGAYNCGRCNKCLLTMTGLEVLGKRQAVATFPPQLDLEAMAAVELGQPVHITLWQDVLDAARAAARSDLEHALEPVLARGKLALGLPADYRRRRRPAPAATVRLAVVIPAWQQAQYLAGAVKSALDQEAEYGVGIVVVNDGCPEPETDRIAQTMRDATPDRIAYLKQPNGGVSAARNAGIDLALRRWPQVEAVFPLDADNMLSPQTLTQLRARLAADPEAAWASPAPEFFGAELGSWQVPGPYLPYRQLFTNQSDTGSLIQRPLFDAGFRYDETIREGFEDWEFFLRASLAGHRGLLAGRCGFRYRRRPESMLSDAQRKQEALEAQIRGLHADAYEVGAQTCREHAEAPRFAVVLCDRAEVRLTAACDLEPRVLSVADYARAIAGGYTKDPIPAITVFTNSAIVDGLGVGELAEALFRLQIELRRTPFVELRSTRDAEGEPAAVAVRANALSRIRLGIPAPEIIVEFGALDGVPRDPRPAARERAVRAVGLAAEEAGTLPQLSHTAFFEHRHIDLMQTTYPLSSGQPIEGQ
ncbi:MAG TPA: glycosyltransferase family A protein [Solirubrobacterales bacterium]|nr:glycosyltransferase family A protein [Solirubrobacterales bacterium]